MRLAALEAFPSVQGMFRRTTGWLRARQANLARVALLSVVVAALVTWGDSLHVEPPARSRPTTIQLLFEHDGLLTLGRLVIGFAGAYVVYSLLSLTWRGRPIKQAGPLGADEQPVKQLAESRDRTARVADEATQTVPELLRRLDERDQLILELREALEAARAEAASAKTPQNP